MKKEILLQLNKQVRPYGTDVTEMISHNISIGCNQRAVWDCIQNADLQNIRTNLVAKRHVNSRNKSHDFERMFEKHIQCKMKYFDNCAR